MRGNAWREATLWKILHRCEVRRHPVFARSYPPEAEPQSSTSQDTIIIHIPPARLGRPRSGPDASRTSSGVEGEPRAAGRFAGLAVSVRYPVSNSMSIMTLAQHVARVAHCFYSDSKTPLQSSPCETRLTWGTPRAHRAISWISPDENVRVVQATSAGLRCRLDADLPPRPSAIVRYNVDSADAQAIPFPWRPRRAPRQAAPPPGQPPPSGRRARPGCP